MRLNRVRVPGPLAERVTLRGAEAHHLRDVLRLKVGAEVEAFDGLGNVAAGTVAGVDRDGVLLELAPARPSEAEPTREVTVAVALLKGDKLADVVRQCTELGAAAFVLLVTRHADVTALSPAKLQRLARVAEEASRQCGRARVPSVTGPVAIDELAWEGRAVVADPRAGRPAAAVLGESAAAASAPSPLTLISGPEGGLAPAEVAALLERGAVAANLGPLILRAETAPVALTAVALLGASPGAPGGAPAALGEGR